MNHPNPKPLTHQDAKDIGAIALEGSGFEGEQPLEAYLGDEQVNPEGGQAPGTEASRG